MLNRIVINNFATIEDLTFDLGTGLNVITGETGAGKSVLVQAISTALGGRADISMVRNGTDKAIIELYCTRGDEEIIIKRELLSSGKSYAKINGESVTLAALREFCKDLVDIHGQYDNQRILDPDNHIYITDSYRMDLIADSLADLSDKYAAYRGALKEYNTLLAEEQKYRREQDFYNFEFEYISKLELKPGEDQELTDQLELMKNSEKIFSAINSSYNALHEDEYSALSILNRCSNELSSVASYNDHLKDSSSELSDIYYRLEDVSSQLRDMLYTLTFSEAEMDSIQERLSVIEDAKRKYHMDVEGIIAYMNELDEKLQLIQNFDYEKNTLKAKVDNAYSELTAAAELVSEKRHTVAARLEKLIEDEITELDFANSEFKINIEKMDEITELGFDKVEFLISTNPGQPLAPLSKIASGGEISRVMLAFKHIIGDSDNMETMIFDEIDTGISGKTALTVGRKLKQIAKGHQIVCITHLPQIAAYGEDNFLISKAIEDGMSHTNINHLDADGKVAMVATLFSGTQDESALSAARDLIEKTAN